MGANVSCKNRFAPASTGGLTLPVNVNVVPAVEMLGKHVDGSPVTVVTFPVRFSPDWERLTPSTMPEGVGAAGAGALGIKLKLHAPFASG